jgi:hypothetical protein
LLAVDAVTHHAAARPMSAEGVSRSFSSICQALVASRLFGVQLHTVHEAQRDRKLPVKLETVSRLLSAFQKRSDRGTHKRLHH